MLDIQYTMPNGEQAATVRVLHPTVNVQTLDAVIAVGAYDAAGNLCETIRVPYKLDSIRDITAEEQERVVTAYFKQTGN